MDSTRLLATAGWMENSGSIVEVSKTSGLIEEIGTEMQALVVAAEICLLE